MMIDRDVILEKINSIQKCLSTIHRVTESNAKKIQDVFVQDVVVLNLQRAAQLSIDIASYMIANLKWGLPATLKDCFAILQNNHAIDAELAGKMMKMVGFRNIAVHDYKVLNIEILKSIVQNHLGDFEAFYAQVLNYLDGVGQ